MSVRTTGEDQHGDLGLNHLVNKAGEEFCKQLAYVSRRRFRVAMVCTGLVRAEGMVNSLHPRNVDREPGIDRGDDVVDLEIAELGIEAKLLEDAGELARA